MKVSKFHCNGMTAIAGIHDWDFRNSWEIFAFFVKDLFL